jgi:hypothetical protein
MTQEKQFVLTEKVLQSVVNYLGTKPYSEVYVLLSQLLKAEPLKKSEETKGNEKEANA